MRLYVAGVDLAQRLFMSKLRGSLTVSQALPPTLTHTRYTHHLTAMQISLLQQEREDLNLPVQLSYWSIGHLTYYALLKNYVWWPYTVSHMYVTLDKRKN